jgi:hypothetical protein
MSATPLKDIWDAAASQPFTPGVSKEAQFQIGFTLLLFAFLCSGVFGLSKRDMTFWIVSNNADVWG